MKKIIFLLLLATGVWLTYNYYNNGAIFLKTPRVAIQPFVGIDDASVNEVKKGIEQYYGIPVTVLPLLELPPYTKNTIFLKNITSNYLFVIEPIV